VRRSLVFACLLMSLLSPVGCRRDGSVDEAGVQREEEGITETYTRGPVSVRVVADRKTITIADRLNLSVQVEHEEGYEIEMPKFGDKLEQFGIVDYRTPPDRMVGKNQVLVEKAYVLEPFLSGEYKIPPMKVRFWKKGEDDAKKHEIETEELSIAVGSLLPEDISDLHDIAPPVALPKGRVGRLWAVIAVGLLILSAVVVVLRFRRRTSAEALVPRIAAHELAFRALEALIAEDLIGAGHV